MAVLGLGETISFSSRADELLQQAVRFTQQGLPEEQRAAHEGLVRSTRLVRVLAWLRGNADIQTDPAAALRWVEALQHQLQQQGSAHAPTSTAQRTVVAKQQEQASFAWLDLQLQEVLWKVCLQAVSQLADTLQQRRDAPTAPATVGPAQDALRNACRLLLGLYRRGRAQGAEVVRALSRAAAQTTLPHGRANDWPPEWLPLEACMQYEGVQCHPSALHLVRMPLAEVVPGQAGKPSSGSGQRHQELTLRSYTQDALQ